MTIFKTPISKEDFKTAMTECHKKAWIWHSNQNFSLALKWKEQRIFEYIDKLEIESEEDFNQDSSSIDLFETYSNLLSSQSKENNKKLDEWKKAWEDPNGFDVAKFAGEAIEDGNAVGEVAKEMFDFKNIQENSLNKTKLKTFDFSPFSFSNALKQTKDILKKQNQYSYLYEAAFEFDNQNFKVRTDILKLKQNNHVEIIEVKATSKVKKEHFFDLMYQAYVLEKNGLIVDNVYLCHLNDNYLRGIDYDSERMTLSKLAKNLEQNSAIISYDEIKDFVNNPIDININDAVSDLDLNNFLIVDPYFKKTAKNKIRLYDVYREFLSQHDLNYLFKKLTDFFALSEDEVIQEFKKNECSLKMSFNHQNKWVYGNYNQNSEPYCFHVVDWFDKKQENIFNFSGLNSEIKAKIYRTTKKAYLKDYNSLFENNIPLNNNNHSYFKEQNERHFETYKKYLKNPNEFKLSDSINKHHLIKIDKILNNYKKYPVYMYDFETVKWAIPRFDKSQGYQQIPFQYSIDVIENDFFDYNNPNSMKHFDFIGQDKNDPRPLFLKNLIRDMFSSGPGIYVAYNDSFEKSVLKYLAILFPEYEKPLMFIVQNTIDLMDFFKGSSKKDLPWFLIYHPDFHGSYSIKKTQPALDPYFSYSDLTINKGDKASQTFRMYVEGLIPDSEWESTIKPDMIKYCNRDTLAMVVILKKIKEIYQEYMDERRGKLNG